ncbi:MAG: helix-turn-helix transcriptional regulator [Myxococcales bacterium]|jgi:transcriptional regulator with XRE-family HTH domain|nr:helix-turn-helix transcriptional regulator [Myxococcales bacterium]
MAIVPDRLADHMVAKHERIGERLKWVRARCGLTVRALADVAGVSFSAITEIELNKRRPRTDTAERLAVALKVAPCWLSYGDGPAPEGWTDEHSATRKGPVEHA